jgi:hypothetical protein
MSASTDCLARVPLVEGLGPKALARGEATAIVELEHRQHDLA